MRHESNISAVFEKVRRFFRFANFVFVPQSNDFALSMDIERILDCKVVYLGNGRKFGSLWRSILGTYADITMKVNPFATHSTVC